MGRKPLRLVLVGTMSLILWSGGTIRAASPDGRLTPLPQTPDDPEVQKLMGELARVGGSLPGSGGAQLASVNLRQADLIEQIINRSKPDQREPWIRQLADCLQVAALNSPAGDRTAHRRLAVLEDYATRNLPGSALAAYITFRQMQATYAADVMQPTRESGADASRPQQQWHDRLVKFVRAYPSAEETPAALLELGLVSELLGPDGEAEKWYGQLLKQFPGTPQAARAEGAQRRLGLEGQMLHLTLPLLDDPGVVLDIDQLRNKLVLVYFWASWDGRTAEDFANFKSLLTRYAPRGVHLLCVNVDNKSDQARAFLKDHSAPGDHVFQEGGLEGRVARRYGLAALPTLMLVGKDGRVISRSIEVGNLEYRLDQLLKPSAVPPGDKAALR